MAVTTPASGQILIAVTGKLVAASKREFARAIIGFGYKLVKANTNGFSILVVGCHPNAEDITQAKTINATIFTERQLLDQIHGLELSEKIKTEAHDPSTPKKRLAQLAAVAPDAVAQNPLWQILHLENPAFLAKESNLLKLRLLRLAPSELLDAVVDSSRNSEISVDVHRVCGTSYEDSDEHELCHEIKVNDYVVTLYCHDCDADMEDVESCEERLSIGDCIKAYLHSPFDDLRAIAQQCGIEYEPNMSPRNGWPLRFAGINIESEEEFLEYESDSFPDDGSLIGRLKELADGAYGGVSLNEVGERRPLFTAHPVADEDASYEGMITVKWTCMCFAPTGDSGDSDTRWQKVRIDEDIRFTGSNVFDDYVIHYQIDFPVELEDCIVSDLKQSSAVSRAVDACLLDVLGLRSGGLTD